MPTLHLEQSHVKYDVVLTSHVTKLMGASIFLSAGLFASELKNIPRNTHAYIWAVTPRMVCVSFPSTFEMSMSLVCKCWTAFFIFSCWSYYFCVSVGDLFTFYHFLSLSSDSFYWTTWPCPHCFSLLLEYPFLLAFDFFLFQKCVCVGGGGMVGWMTMTHVN